MLITYGNNSIDITRSAYPLYHSPHSLSNYFLANFILILTMCFVADQKKTSKWNYWLGWSYHLESVADNTWIRDAIHQVYTDINDGLLEDGSNGFCVDNYCDSIQIMVTGDLNLTVSVSVTSVK